MSSDFVKSSRNLNETDQAFDRGLLLDSDPKQDTTTHDVPPPIDLSHIPEAILNTSTVETLLGYIDDITSRLKVNLRKSAAVDGRLLALERELKTTSQLRNSLEAQLQIAREKFRTLELRSKQVLETRAEVEDQLNFAQVKVSSIESKKLEIQSQLRRHEAYRRRVARWVAPGFSQKKKSIEQLEKIVIELNGRLDIKQGQVSDLKARSRELEEIVEKKRAQHTADQTMIVERYEKKIEELTAELKLYSEKALRVEQLMASESNAKNRLIYFERRAEELESRLRSETHALQIDLVRSREESRHFAEQFLTIKKQSEAIELKYRTEHQQTQSQARDLENIRADLGN
jgi:hypothetical protein